MGGDLAALIVVAPFFLVVGAMARRHHPAAPVLALAETLIAMYAYFQLILSNEYPKLPGKVERFFPFVPNQLSGCGVCNGTCGDPDPAGEPMRRRRRCWLRAHAWMSNSKVCGVA